MNDQGVTKFTYNWNNKLNNRRYFTTIRRYNPEKYAIGCIHQILLKTPDGWVTDFEKAVIVDAKCISLKEISTNNYICGLDTGYSPEETVSILKRMHKGINDSTLFSLVLYKYVNESLKK